MAASLTGVSLIRQPSLNICKMAMKNVVMLFAILLVGCSAGRFGVSYFADTEEAKTEAGTALTTYSNQVGVNFELVKVESAAKEEYTKTLPNSYFFRTVKYQIRVSMKPAKEQPKLDGTSKLMAELAVENVRTCSFYVEHRREDDMLFVPEVKQMGSCVVEKKGPSTEIEAALPLYDGPSLL